MKQNAIKVVFSNKSTTPAIPTGTKMLVRRACTAVLRLENYTGDAVIGVTFTTVRGLNAAAKFGITASTEPFMVAQEDGMLGRVYLSLENTKRVSALHNRPAATELVYTTVKAVLLLLGYSEHDDLDGKIEWIMHCFGMPISTKYAVLQYA